MAAEFESEFSPRRHLTTDGGSGGKLKLNVSIMKAKFCDKITDELSKKKHPYYGFQVSKWRKLGFSVL